MRIWVDDIRPAPEGYIWCRSVNETINTIDSLDMMCGSFDSMIELIDIDHDAGDFASDGGDYIKLLDYFEECFGKDLPYKIKIHSMNPVGVENMRRIIQKNGWKEVIE